MPENIAEMREDRHAQAVHVVAEKAQPVRVLAQRQRQAAQRRAA